MWKPTDLACIADAFFHRYDPSDSGTVDAARMTEASACDTCES